MLLLLSGFIMKLLFIAPWYLAYSWNTEAVELNFTAQTRAVGIAISADLLPYRGTKLHQ